MLRILWCFLLSGPTKEQIEETTFEMIIFGTGWDWLHCRPLAPSKNIGLYFCNQIFRQVETPFSINIRSISSSRSPCNTEDLWAGAWICCNRKTSHLCCIECSHGPTKFSKTARIPGLGHLNWIGTVEFDWDTWIRLGHLVRYRSTCYSSSFATQLRTFPACCRLYCLAVESLRLDIFSVIVIPLWKELRMKESCSISLSMRRTIMNRTLQVRIVILLSCIPFLSQLFFHSSNIRFSVKHSALDEICVSQCNKTYSNER